MKAETNRIPGSSLTKFGVGKINGSNSVAMVTEAADQDAVPESGCSI